MLSTGILMFLDLWFRDCWALLIPQIIPWNTGWPQESAIAFTKFWVLKVLVEPQGLSHGELPNKQARPWARSGGPQRAWENRDREERATAEGLQSHPLLPKRHLTGSTRVDHWSHSKRFTSWANGQNKDPPRFMSRVFVARRRFVEPRHTRFGHMSKAKDATQQRKLG